MFAGTSAKNDIKGKILRVFHIVNDKYISNVGLTAAHTFRLTSLPDASGIKCFYQSDAAATGWFPRPAPAISSEIWNSLFKHPSSINQGRFLFNWLLGIIISFC
jgi:hypothetical protein